MKKYKISGSSVIIIEENNSKAAPYFEKFEVSEDKLIQDEESCFIELKSVVADEELNRVKKFYIGTAGIEETICYNIRHQIINGEWKHFIMRENPLTDSFLIASSKWNHICIFDKVKFQNKLVDIGRKKSNLTTSYIVNKENEWMELFLAGFYSYMVQHETMMMHASAVKYQGKAIVYTAPSGTGKTTQAVLWRDYVGAKILNGDRVFINNSKEESRLFAWGSPWSGSSPYIVNDSAEVAAIVVLEQAPENSLRKMDVAEAMMHLSSNSFLPMWDARCLEGMLGVMDLVLRKVPVYKLACRPDEGAVELVRQELFG